MKNVEVVNAFIDVLLQDPQLAMQAVALRLSPTKYELTLKTVDPLKECGHPDPYQFPINTAERHLATA